MYFICPIHKLVLYKYFKKAPGALPNPNGSPLGCMPSKAVSSANLEMSGLVHQDTGQNSKTLNTTRGRYASFSATKSTSSSIVSQSLSRHWIRIDSIRLIMEVWVLLYLSPPLPLHTVFAKLNFPLIREIYGLWNMSPLWYEFHFMIIVDQNADKSNAWSKIHYGNIINQSAGKLAGYNGCKTVFCWMAH